MKRKQIMAALLCTVCLTASSLAAGTALAEEPESVTGAAESVSEDMTEAQSEDTTEAQSEDASEAQTETEALVRPEYKALDYVTLGEYKGLTVEKVPLEVTDKEIDDEIRLAVQLADALEEYNEGQVQEGDTANIDFEGKLNGEAFDGGTSTGYDLVIGSGSFIEGFEDGLVGVAVGETVDLPLTFPENYVSEELAGQNVVFTVTVNSIKRVPELTDELVSTITDGEYTDVASYRDSVTEDLMADKEEGEESAINSELLTLIANTSEIKDYPQEMIDYSAQEMKSYYQQYAEVYGMEYTDFLESFLGMTEDEFDSAVDTAVKQNLQQEMYLQAIAETEGIEVSDEDYTAGCAEYAAKYGYESGEDLIAAYGEDTVRLSLLQDKVLDFVRENAVITEEPESESGSEDGTESDTAAETEAVTG